MTTMTSKRIAWNLLLPIGLALLVYGCATAPEAPPAEAPAAPAAPVPPPAPEPPPPPAPPPAPEVAAPPAPPDPAVVGADTYKVLLDNPRVRILMVTMNQGASVPMHGHPDHVAYVLSAGKLRITPEGGAPQELKLKKGDAMFIPAERHTGENAGNTTVQAVIVEIKAGATAGAMPAGDDPVTVGPKIYKKVFENDAVRVSQIKFKKGAKIPMHSHPDHAIYVVKGGKLRVTGADGTAQDLDLAAGQAVFSPAQAHSGENVEKSTVEAVIFELKR